MSQDSSEQCINLADLTDEIGALSVAASSDGGVKSTVTFTPADICSDATNVVRLDLAGVSDVAGNAGVGSAVSNSYSVAAGPLTLVVKVSDTTLVAGETEPSRESCRCFVSGVLG